MLSKIIVGFFLLGCLHITSGVIIFIPSAKLGNLVSSPLMITSTAIPL